MSEENKSPKPDLSDPKVSDSKEKIDQSVANAKCITVIAMIACSVFAIGGIIGCLLCAFFLKDTTIQIISFSFLGLASLVGILCIPICLSFYLKKVFVYREISGDELHEVNLG